MEQISENNIYQGDCLELIKGIPDGTVDCIITDPPYGTTKNKWDKRVDIAAMLQEFKRVLKPNGAMCIFGQEPFSSEMRLAGKFFRYDWIWQKKRPLGFLNANKMPLRDYEIISVFYRHLPTYNPQFSSGKPYAKFPSKRGRSTTNYGDFKDIPRIYDGCRYPKSVLQFPYDKEKLHPTQKPVALIEYLIKTYTNPGELVLDCFLGCGTTAVAAINTGRKYIGFELDDGYYKMAQERIGQSRAAAIRSNT